jgi:hypothetical protein
MGPGTSRTGGFFAFPRISVQNNWMILNIRARFTEHREQPSKLFFFRPNRVAAVFQFGEFLNVDSEKGFKFGTGKK